MRLAMSDELATDEEADMGDYEVHTLGGPNDLDDDAVEFGTEHLHHLSRVEDAARKARSEQAPPAYPENGEGTASLHKTESDDALVFDADADDSFPAPPASYKAEGSGAERARLRLSDDEDNDHRSN